MIEQIKIITDISIDITKTQKPETDIINCNASDKIILNKNKKYKYRILFPLTRGVPILLIYESNIDLDDNLKNFFTNNSDILYNSLLDSKMNIEEKIVKEVYKSHKPVQLINPVTESNRLIDSYKNDTYEETKDGENTIITATNELGFKKIDYGKLPDQLSNKYTSIIYYYKDQPFLILNGIELTPGREIDSITDGELAIYKKYAQCDIDIDKLTENKNNLLWFDEQTLKDDTVSRVILRYTYNDETSVTVQIINDGQFMIETISDYTGNIINTYEINDGLIYSESYSGYLKTCEFGPYKYRCLKLIDALLPGLFKFEYESALLSFKIKQNKGKYDISVDSYIYTEQDEYCLYRDEYGLLNKLVFANYKQ